jgi:thymidylate kinase
MSFIIVEGLDRTGKTTLVNYYANKGYKPLHFSAPDKKYSQPGYSGPSYLEEIIEMLVSLSGQDVVLDRSHYGELIWPYVYGRRPLLNHYDLEILREIELQNQAKYILMHDSDVENHWKRCVQYKEPLTRTQFDSARSMFQDMAKQYDFSKMTLEDLSMLENEDKKKQTSKDTENSTMETQSIKDIDVFPIGKNKHNDLLSPEQLKLAEANAINEILTSRIVKKKGDHFDVIEEKIRYFLNNQLADLLGTGKNNQFESFSKEEIEMLKAVVKRMREKK